MSGKAQFLPYILLWGKICDLSKFVKKTLINAGEDVMNKIIDNLNAKRGKPVSCVIV